VWLVNDITEGWAEIQKQSALKPFRTVEYDTLKIYVKAHGFKVNIISLGRANDPDPKFNH
jgi:hypothetical protein